MDNLTLGKYHYFHRHVRLKNMPQVWFVEVTNDCNLHCKMCPRRKMTREVGYMRFELFKAIIDKIKKTTNILYLHQFGEPLLHPELGSFINYCSANKIEPAISTNAMLLDTDKAKMLLDSSLQRIRLCLDGADRDTYGTLRAGGDFDRAKDNIMNFLRIAQTRKRTDLKIGVQIIKMKDTLGEIEAFKKEWSGYGADVVVKKFSDWGRQVADILDHELPTTLPAQQGPRYPCMGLWLQGGVQWNGDFIVCDMDFNGHSVAGNLGKEPLMAIWNSPRMLKLRQEHIENSREDNLLCKNCALCRGEEKDMLYPRLGMLARFYEKQYYPRRIAYYIQHRGQIPGMLKRKIIK